LQVSTIKWGSLTLGE